MFKLVRLLTCIPEVPHCNYQPGHTIVTEGFVLPSAPADKFQEITFSWALFTSFHITSTLLYAVIQSFNTVLSQLLSETLDNLQMNK